MQDIARGRIVRPLVGAGELREQHMRGRLGQKPIRIGEPVKTKTSPPAWWAGFIFSGAID
jgi:hypothetical protein